MATEFVRDQATDPLLTPRNAALVVIDYQPSQVQTVTSMDRELLVDNIVSVARLATTFDLPVVLSTVNVANGQGPTIPELKAVLETAFKLRRRSDCALGAEHLLLGLLADDGSAAGRIMRAAGAEFETACRMGFLVPGGERGFLLATSPWLARP